ncbi:putative Smr domain-containing protein [Helianthus anomalus]
MSRRRAKTPGWAAFDPKNQQKQVTNIETHNDPYPPISTTLQHHQNPSRNGNLTGKSFFSVLTHSSASKTAHSPLMENRRSDKMTSNNISRVYEKLKIDHPWASENLIEDIVEAVDDDFDKASALLNEMAPQEKKEAELDNNVEEVDLTAKNYQRLDEHNNSGMVLVDDNLPLGFMSMIPVEPEWEDDDMYLMHRKEAIRAMRLASRHSKAASEAYLRRDHTAAQEHSLKAREEWSNAEKLHAKAAKEILTIRNCENDDWKLDLHGLHATEAVQVLLERLLKIESQSSYATKPHKTNLKVGLETEKSDRQQQLSKPRLLEVITGKGSHSRGEAALPVAIKSFLSEKGYYYYEARIGVITVQPKFRQLSTALSNH